jgi:putative ABC transport system permease protein
MLKNYLKVAFKILLRNKVFSFVTVFGFSLGITAVILILLFIRYELSYDKSFKDADRIYRVQIKSKESSGNETTSPLCAPNTISYIKNNIPEIEYASRLYQCWYPQEIKTGNSTFRGENYFWADEEFFKIFNIPFLYGANESALKEPYSIVIKKDIAERYFGNKNPLGNALYINNKDYRITGVFYEFTSNSHFHPDFIVSFNTLNEKNEVYNQGLSFYTYVKIKSGVDLNLLKYKINDNILNSIRSFTSGESVQKYLSAGLLSLTDIHLYSHTKYELEPNGNIINIYLFSILIIFILIIASANYINLMTSRSQERAKEIGIRKVIGAGRKDLIIQLLFESVLVSSISYCISLFLVEIFINRFSFLINRNLSFSILNDFLLSAGLFAMVIILGIISGLYPALFISSRQASVILKDKKASFGKKINLNKTLIFVQFSIAIFLLSSLIIITNQMSFLKNKDLGFDKERVLIINNFTKSISKKAGAIRNELLASGYFKNVAISQHIPGSKPSGQEAYAEDQPESSAIEIFEVRSGYGYLDTYGLKLTDGRDFSETITSDSNNAVILNETAVKALGLQNPVGKSIELGFSHPGIIGVVKDFNFESLYEPIKPLFIHVGLQPWRPENISVRTFPGKILESIEFIKRKMKDFDAGYEFSYNFLDKTLNTVYESERRNQEIITYSTILIFFIASMGLFAQAQHSTLRRKKEIGIRKVLGASANSILSALLKEYFIPVSVAFLVGTPLSYILIENWLNGFAYRVDINYLLVILNACITVFIVSLTVFYQAAKIIKTNPIEVLRNE